MKSLKSISKICTLFLFAGILIPAIGIGAFAATAVAGALLLKTMPQTGLAFELVNPASLTWHGKEVQSMTETIFETVYLNPELNELHVIAEGIVADQQIVFLGRLSKITKKAGACGTGLTNKNIPMSEKFWSPVRTKFWLAQCAEDLEESFWIWGTQKGIKRDDLTGTDFAEFVMLRMGDALGEDAMRIVWFNDTDHATVDDSPAGVLTSGTDVTDYNIINGLWSQAYAVVASDSDRLVAISRNAQSTYANQRFSAADVTNKVVIGILQDVVDNSDTRLSERDDAVLMVTKSVFDQYKKELKSYTELESAYTILQNGKKVLTFDGYEVRKISFWDRTIRSDFNDGTKWFQPHRVMFTVKANIPVGFDASEAIKKIEQWYEMKDEKMNWRGKYKIDTKILEDYMVQFAY